MTAEQERAAVVAWLRADDSDLREILRLSLQSKWDEARDVALLSDARRKLANAIERRAHHPDTRDEG